MKTKDEKLMESGVLLLIGRTALPIGLVLLLTRAFFGKPHDLTRPLVATAAGALLLAAAASRLDDADVFTGELVRALTFAAMIIAAVLARVYFHRAPHALSPRELHAAVACAAGFVGGILWLRRERGGE